MLTGSVSRWSAIRSAVSLAALVGLTMCANIDNIDIATAGKVVVPKATLIETVLGGLAFGGFDSVDFSQDFKNQGVSKDDVDSVHLRTMTLLVEAPASGNFDFITSVRFFAKAEGLDKIELGSMESIPKGKRQLDLAVNTEVELKPYVVAPRMQILSEITGSRPGEETTVAAAVVLDVDIHVPGCN
jgi:hypothetical protein